MPPTSATLKLATYDARRYGSLTGLIENMSPSIVVDETNGATFFHGFVQLEAETIGSGEWQRPKRVGMLTNAEIATDERSMMVHLANPIHRSLQQAFGER